MVKKWEIYFMNLNPTQGSEQQGIRPVLIISNDAVNTYLPICTIVPFSSYKKDCKIYPTEILMSSSDTGLSKDSILMLQQIRTVDTARLCSPKVGIIENDQLKEKINEAIRDYFEL